MQMSDLQKNHLWHLSHLMNHMLWFLYWMFDEDGADWTFVCPNEYENITDKSKRVSLFYKNGFSAISKFLKELEYKAEIEIPKRYRRHMDYLTNSDYGN